MGKDDKDITVDYSDIITQLKRDRANFDKQEKDCDRQIRTFTDQKLMNKGAKQYCDLFLQRFAPPPEKQ